MRKGWILLALVVIVAAATSNASAQSASDSITVTATNNGIFSFSITAASFDFGNVNADGTVSSTGVAGVRNSSGAVYTAAAATTWTCNSAPVRTVRVFNASTTSTINWGTAARLSLQVPSTGLPGGSTSCGYKTFSTAGDGGAGNCGAGNLVHSVSTGNGSNAVTGNLDLRLDVLDTDGTGANSWTVVLTAAGA